MTLLDPTAQRKSLKVRVKGIQLILADITSLVYEDNSSFRWIVGRGGNCEPW